MTSFVATTGLTTGQSLVSFETGVVTGNGGIYASSGAAVSMASSTQLTVLGDVVAQTASAVVVSSIFVGVVNVGAGAALVSAAFGGSALSGSINGSPRVDNAGEMMGGSGVALTLLNSGSSLALANAGRISATSSSAALSLTFQAAASATINNSGVIEGTGNSDGLNFTGSGTVNLTNSGLISAGPADAAILGSGSLKMDNAGQIIGDVQVSGAAVINTSGTILGDVGLGSDGDKVKVSGLVDGSIDLGEGNNEFMLLGGHVTGTATGGTGWDSYFVDQSNVQIVDNGGSRDYLQSWVDIVIAQGIEVTLLVGADGLKAIGSALGETVYGSAGDDTIAGQGGDDNLFGNMATMCWPGARAATICRAPPVTTC